MSLQNNKAMLFFRSMAGRVFLILVLGVVAASALTLWLAFGERQKTLQQYREAHAIERVEQLVQAVNALPAESREAFLKKAPRLGLSIAHGPLEGSTSLPQSKFANALENRLGAEFNVRSLEIAPEHCPRIPEPHPVPANRPPQPCEELLISLQDHMQLRLHVMQPRGGVPPPNPDFPFYILLYLLIIALLAFIVARMTMLPLKQMAQAAEYLGQDINRAPLEERGTSEIRQATKAFNAMQGRIKSHIQQRTHMLAAITHDLQTPLTRLRLRFEKVQDESVRNKLIEDLSAMQMMVKEGLELARSLDSSENMQTLDLDSLLDSVCVDASDAGQNVQFEGSSQLSVLAKPMALRRCMVNLIDNAVKYGHSAQVSIREVQEGNKKMAQISVRDKGPGIPAEFLNKVFEPFFRMESSRSRDTGGTGLGLTIAQNIAQQHDGRLELFNLSQGGLEARLTLPVKS